MKEKGDKLDTGLIVREPYATFIVEGVKKWELRTRKTNKRGRVYIISNGEIKGTVEIKDVKGPYDIEELSKHWDKHRVPKEELEKYAGKRKIYAWVLENPVKIDKPIKIKVPRGAVVWVKIKEDIAELREG